MYQKMKSNLLEKKKEVRDPDDSDSKKKKNEVKSYPGVRLFFWQNVDLFIYLFKAASSEFLKKFFSSFM